MPVAELQNVGKNYGAVTALRGISLAIERGELVAVLGPNGAGKTTAVRSETQGRQGKDRDARAGTREVKLARLFTVSGMNDDGRPVMDPGSSSYAFPRRQGRPRRPGGGRVRPPRRGEHFTAGGCTCG